MPMYYFLIYLKNGYVLDEHGAQFADNRGACREAVRIIRQVVAEKTANGEVLDGILFEMKSLDGWLMEQVAIDKFAISKQVPHFY